MAITLNALIGAEVFHTSSDDPVAVVSDAGMDVDARRLTCLYLTDPEGRGRSFGLSPTSDFRWWEGRLFLEMGQDALDARNLRLEAQAAQGSVDVAGGPSILTGPFGYTIAPTLAGVLINDAFTEAADRPNLSQNETHLVWASDLLDRPVFDSSGELGILQELSFSNDTFALSGLHIKREKGGVEIRPVTDLQTVTRNMESITLRSEGAQNPTHWEPIQILSVDRSV